MLNASNLKDAMGSHSIAILCLPLQQGKDQMAQMNKVVTHLNLTKGHSIVSCCTDQARHKQRPGR